MPPALHDNTPTADGNATPPGTGPRRGLARGLVVGLAALAATAVGMLALLGLSLLLALPNLPDIEGLTDYRPKLPMRVVSSDGVLLGEFGEERRHFMAIGQMPKVMKDAVLAAEDSRFFQHGGVDYIGVLRAGLAQFSDAKSQGASTITMQVARNFYLPTEKTYIRKIYEILLALKIESRLTKDQILEIYMNQIFLGQRAHGFAAAAEIYFGKPLDKISPAEAAMLAGLPKAPSAFNPLVNPRRATQRQRYILERMQDNGFLTADEVRAAREQRLVYRPPQAQAVHAEFVAEMARQLVHAQYGDETYSRGLTVQVYVRAADQAIAYRALRRAILEYEQRQHYRGPEAFADLPADERALDARIAEILADHPDNDELRAAVVVEVGGKEVHAVLQSGEDIVIKGDGLKPVASGLAENAAAHKRIRRGAVVRVLRDAKGAWILTQLPEVEGAFVATDPRTGAIRALVGGFDFAKSKFNHVTQAWRQPGSSFKPFIYSAALERGFTGATIVNDAPLFFDAETTGSQPWEPRNYDGTFEGPMPLRRALAKSKNMVSIRILQSIGAPYAQSWIGHFGFDTDKHPPYLTMALGAGSVTPMQMAAAYGVFATGGHLVAPRLVARITDDKEHVLYEAPEPALDDSNRVLDERNAFVMTTLLQEVTRSGTAARAQATLKRPDLYGKTGTTNDSMDAWFAGWQPSVAAVVWIGYDQPRKLGSRETGGGLALPVWIEFMTHALKDVPIADASAPEGVVQVGGEWIFDEFAGADGVRSVGLDDKLPKPPTEDERKSILDLFRR